MNESMNGSIHAVLWDFGGVFTTSPFLSFARFERENNLPENFLRKVNTTNSEHNAWAQFESAKITAEAFDEAFAVESEALGHRVSGSQVIELLRGALEPQMIAALRQCKKLGLKTACITNNVRKQDSETLMENELGQVMALFDYVVESSKVGIRKPDPKIYLMACDALNIEPHNAVYLDDLGINLKPARALGMKTIKVVSVGQALGELEEILQTSFG